MPNRILRDGINSSPRVNRLSMGAEILYRRLMSIVDDYGRFHAAPVTIRGACWPTCPDKVTEKQVSSWLSECSTGDRPLIQVYESESARYLQLEGFGQQVRTKSKFPQPASTLKSICQQSEIILRADCEQNVGTSRSRSRSRSAESETKALGAVFDLPLWIAERTAAHPLPSGGYLCESVVCELVNRPAGFTPAEFELRHEEWIAWWAANPDQPPGPCKFEKFVTDGYWKKSPPKARENRRKTVAEQLIDKIEMEERA